MDTSTPSSAELERIHDIITTARRTTRADDEHRRTPPAAKRLSFASDCSPLVVTTARPATHTRAILDSDTDEEQPLSAGAHRHAPESSDGAASSSDYHSASSGHDDDDDDLGAALQALTVQGFPPPATPLQSHPLCSSDDDSDVQLVVPRSTIRSTRCVLWCIEARRQPLRRRLLVTDSDDAPSSAADDRDATQDASSGDNASPRPPSGVGQPGDRIQAIPAAAPHPPPPTAAPRRTRRPHPSLAPATRDALARQLFLQYAQRITGVVPQAARRYNDEAFDGALPPDLQLTWSKHLRTTAGVTLYQRTPGRDAWQHAARIELSVKVLDTEAKLRATLCHEMCHAAAWLVDGVAKPPHGPVFRKWAAQVMARCPGLEVSTCHSYEIAYAYRWQCTNSWCQKVYGRHSNSLDVATKVCGVCRGRLQRINADGTKAAARAPTPYSLFVKEHFSAAKARCGAGTPHKEVMRELAAEWQARKVVGGAGRQVCEGGRQVCASSD